MQGNKEFFIDDEHCQRQQYIVFYMGFKYEPNENQLSVILIRHGGVYNQLMNLLRDKKMHNVIVKALGNKPSQDKFFLIKEHGIITNKVVRQDYGSMDEELIISGVTDDTVKLSRMIKIGMLGI